MSILYSWFCFGQCILTVLLCLECISKELLPKCPDYWETLDKNGIIIIQQILSNKTFKETIPLVYTIMTSVLAFYLGHNRLLLVTFYHIRQLFPTIILDSLVCLLICNRDIEKHYTDKCDLTATYQILTNPISQGKCIS